MNILVINCGSSSLKFQLIDSETEKVLAKGNCERIGIDGRLVYAPAGGAKETTDYDMPSHKEAISCMLTALTGDKTGVIKELSEIGAVGHRVVHGGERFTSSVIVNDEVKKAIEECSDLAPLHNPANLIGIHACEELMPGTPNVVVFDTAFHQTMPAKAYMYGLPYRYYEDYRIRKYGFHGTSHSYVSKRAAAFLGEDIKNMKMIVCHLGNGASLSAVMNGECIDTSMGLTPLEGLVMGTRSGDVDPSVVEYIAKKENAGVSEVLNILNKQSGLFGLSKNLSSDIRDIWSGIEADNEYAILAMDVFCYRIAKYIGSYAAAMNGVDAIVFTAGIGENDHGVREKVCSYLNYLGTTLDLEANNVRGTEAVISTEDSKVKLLAIPTNEELAIARETFELVSK